MLQPKHFLWSLDGKVATITLNRPERKNPLTFESYAELRDTFRALAHETSVKAVVISRCRRQFLFGRRRARDHRPAGAHAGSGRRPGAAEFHPHDRRSGEGDACLPADHRRGGRWHLRRCRRDRGDGVRSAARHRSQQGGVPVRPCRPGGRRYGRVQYPAAPHRRRTRRRIAVHRTLDERRRKRNAGASSIGCARRTRCLPRRRRWRHRSPPARPSRTP